MLIGYDALCLSRLTFHRFQDEPNLIPTDPEPLSRVPQERFNTFLHLAHHRGTRTQPFHASELAQCGGRRKIDPPNQGGIAAIHLHGPQLVERDQSIEAATTVVTQIGGLPAVADRSGVKRVQAHRGLAFHIE